MTTYKGYRMTAEQALARARSVRAHPPENEDDAWVTIQLPSGDLVDYWLGGIDLGGAERNVLSEPNRVYRYIPR